MRLPPKSARHIVPLVIPNPHQGPLPGEDVQTFEQDLPGANTGGFNTTTIGSLPLETSLTILTMNGSWGFNLTGSAFKPAPRLIQTLVRAAGNDANLLLNIGPRPDGTIQPEAVERLQELGLWMGTYGSSIYGTRGGPIAPREWGVTTQRGDTVYVYVLDWEDPVLAIPSLGDRITGAYMLDSGRPVEVSLEEDAITLRLPDTDTDKPDRVVVLTTSGAG